MEFAAGQAIGIHPPNLLRHCKQSVSPRIGVQWCKKDMGEDMGMDQYLLIPFLMGWTSINPSYFDVNYRDSMGFDTLPTLEDEMDTLGRHCAAGSSLWDRFWFLLQTWALPKNSIPKPNIIKYHQISSNIITYHHISSHITCCQMLSNIWSKIIKPVEPKASNLRRTTCREASLGYRGRGSQQVQEQFFQAPIGLEDRAPLESGGCIPFVHQKKQDIFGGLFNVWCEHVYKDGCLPVATPKKINMICDYFDMNLVLYRGAIIGQVMIVLLQPSGLK